MAKKFTLEERKLLEKYAPSCLSGMQIAAIIKRSKNGVIAEYRVNGGRDNYNAEAAHKESELRLKNSYQKLKKHPNLKKGAHFYNNLKRGVDIINMQLDLIVEQIKEIKNELENK